MKSRIALPGSKNDEGDELQTHSATCSMIGIRILIFVTVMFGWILVEIDFTTAFLQIGRALWDVKVPPCKSRNQIFYCLLLPAAYGLVNANTKLQMLSNESLRVVEFVPLFILAQHFFLTGHKSPRYSICQGIR